MRISIRAALLAAILGQATSAMAEVRPAKSDRPVAYTAKATELAEPEGEVTAPESDDLTYSPDSIGTRHCHDSCRPKLCCGNNTPKFYFVGEALWLHLNQTSAFPVVQNQNTLATALNTNALNFGTRAGPRLTVGYRFSQCGTAELSYFGLQDWHASAAARGNNNLTLPGDLGPATDDFFGANVMQVNSAARLNNVEANYWHQTSRSRLSLLAGFRYFNFSDKFDITAVDSDTSISNYRTSTRNNLFGAQAGARWRAQRGIWGLEIVKKAGIYGNNASQSTYLGDFGNTVVLRNSHTNGGSTAFIAEIGVNGRMQLTNWLYFRGGYNLIWVDGIARAANQLDFSNHAGSGTTLHDRSNLFLHGANLGLEARW